MNWVKSVNLKNKYQILNEIKLKLVYINLNHGIVSYVKLEYKPIRILIFFCIIFLYISFFWKNFANIISPTHDVLWNTPTAALIIGDLRFQVYEPGIVDILGKQIPIISGPYLGALKSYILSIFFLTNNYVAANYLLNQILFALVVVITTLIVRFFASTKYAILSSFLFVLSTGYLFSASQDYGPYLLGTLLILISLLLHLHQKNNLIIFIASIICLGLAINDKLTIIPLAIPLIVYYFYEIIYSKRCILKIFMMFTILFLMIINYIYYFINYGFSDLLNMVGKNDIGSMFTLTNFIDQINAFIVSSIYFSNSYLYSAYFGIPINNLHIRLIYLSLIIYIILLFWFIFSKSPKPLKFLIVWFPCSFFINTLMNPRPWHWMPLVPIFILSIVFISQFIFNQFNLKIKTKNIVSILFFAFTLILTLNRDTTLYNNAQRGGQGIASPALIKLAESLDISGNKFNLVCLNYSICQPLLALSNNKNISVYDDYSFSNVLDWKSNFDRYTNCEFLIIGREGKNEVSDFYSSLLYQNTNYLLSSSSLRNRFQVSKIMLDDGNKSLNLYRPIGCQKL